MKTDRENKPSAAPAFRVLHTSDLHLGATLYGYDRQVSQRAMLSALADAVAAAPYDALLVSGDVFDNGQPSAAAQRMLSEAMADIRRRCPGMAIVITGGNHDSASRLDAFRPVWDIAGVTVVGGWRPTSVYDDFIIPVGDRGFVVAVPYIGERSLPQDFYSQVLERVAELNPAGLPVVMMAHTTVVGCGVRGHDTVTERGVGGIDAVAIADMGTGYDYLALGHIHMPQTLTRGDRRVVRYCGTPLAVSFDEDYPHSLSDVSISADHTVQVDTIPMTDPWPLMTVPPSGFAPFDQALDMLSALDPDLQAYVRLNVSLKPGQKAPDDERLLINRAVDGKACRFCLANYRREESGTDGSADGGGNMTLQEFASLSPRQVAIKFMADSGIEATDDLMDLFDIAANDDEDK